MKAFLRRKNQIAFSLSVTFLEIGEEENKAKAEVEAKLSRP
jgi:hypothetical protein